MGNSLTHATTCGQSQPRLWCDLFCHCPNRATQSTRPRLEYDREVAPGKRLGSELRIGL